jgi:2,3-bisphosphoglycerate-independent phosphoglycerate mutase
VQGCEPVDACVGKVVDAVSAAGGGCLITADHGNAEQELQPDGTPHTAHTTNPVPLVVTRAGLELRDGGELADLIPSCLDLLGLERPAAMTGKSLFTL